MKTKAKKDAVAAAAPKEDLKTDDVPDVESSEEQELPKAKAGRKKKTGTIKPVDDSLPKRTLRSNSSKTGLPASPEPPVEKKEKARKAPAKSSKKTVATNGNEAAPSDSGANGSGIANGAPEEVIVKPAASKGRPKKADKPAASKPDKKEPEVLEASGDEEEKVVPPQSKAKGKPVKATVVKDKMKVEPAPAAKDESDSAGEPDSNGDSMDVEVKEPEKAARGKKKADKPKDEEVAVAPKKSKKEPTKKAGGSEASEDAKAKTESKKAGSKGDGAAIKEVAVEHCKS